jgi:diaminohydroxyphosphoribosylaminopyrimidine deaminase / 5-amino-6-(5-phosphoribosylamino)uracil reductase
MQGHVRPTVTLSYAQTLDGRMATLGGSSQWISGPPALRWSHALRARHDALMVGIGTVLADDPRLTVRLVEGTNPLRVVVDSLLRTPLQAAVLRAGAAHGTLLATTERAARERVAALEALGATVLVLPQNKAGQVDLTALLAALAARNVKTVMVEGGPTLLTALLRQQLADQLAICVAPKILGAGREAVGDLGIRALNDALLLHEARFTPCGADLLFEARIAYAGGAP